MARRIEIIVIADDDADLDLEDSTGLTNAAYERLVDALADAGFSNEEIRLRPVFPGEAGR